MRRSVALRSLVVAGLLALLPPTLTAAEDAPAADAVPEAWVTITSIEHRRGDPAGLDPFLAADADPVAQTRAITALGRRGRDRGPRGRRGGARSR